MCSACPRKLHPYGCCLSTELAFDTATRTHIITPSWSRPIRSMISHWYSSSRIDALTTAGFGEPICVNCNVNRCAIHTCVSLTWPGCIVKRCPYDLAKSPASFNSAAAYSSEYPYLSCDANGNISDDKRMNRILRVSLQIYCFWDKAPYLLSSFHCSSALEPV